MRLNGTLKRMLGGFSTSGPAPAPASAAEDVAQVLEDNGVLFTTLSDACKACEDPCDLGSYPPKFDIDTTSQLLGSAKPYGRQVIISTGESNWPKEVTEESGSLAALLSDVHDSFTKKKGPSVAGGGNKDKDKDKDKESWPAFFDTSSSSRLSILNGSHRSISDGPAQYTVVVLPDFKFISDVGVSNEDAKYLWSTNLNLTLGRAGIPPSTGGLTSPLKSWPLPYNVVILICSHKRRDNRCGIAAPILENAFTTVLNARQWDVHTQIDDSCTSEPSLENITGSTEEREEVFIQRLKAASSAIEPEKRALILKTSHVGGHKFAGNVIIYWPSGTSVWYGRVSPKEVTAVVDETVLGGRVIPELLRAGVNIAPAGKKSLYDW